MRVQPAAKTPRVSVVEIYRGIEILRVEVGKKTVYEVSGDLAAELGAADNGDLEDQMCGVAKRAKKKIQWSSEADTFVAQAADVEACRWLVDALRAATPAP